MITKDKLDMFAMGVLEEQEINKFVEKIVEIFDGFGLLPRDMNANYRVNLRNAKIKLEELLRDRDGCDS